MREDLKNFEITPAEVNNCAGQDIYNVSLSQEMRNQVWQQEYKKRLQSTLEANGVKSWLESLVKVGFLNAKPLSLDIPSATNADEYLNSLVEQKIFVIKDFFGAFLSSVFGAVGFFFIFFTLRDLLNVNLKTGDLLLSFILTVVSVSFAYSFYKESAKNNKKVELESKEIREKIAKAKADVAKEVDVYMIQYEEVYKSKNAPSHILAALLQEVKKYNQGKRI